MNQFVSLQSLENIPFRKHLLDPYLSTRLINCIMPDFLPQMALYAPEGRWMHESVLIVEAPAVQGVGLRQMHHVQGEMP
jgi:hypothetical protein